MNSSGSGLQTEGKKIFLVAPLVVEVDISKFEGKPSIEQLKAYLHSSLLEIPFDDRPNPIQLVYAEVAVDRFHIMTPEQVQHHIDFVDGKK